VEGSSEHDNEPLGSVKDKEFLKYLSDFCILKKYCSMELVKWNLHDWHTFRNR